MNKEFGMINHELAWMPKGSFDSFSAGSGTHYSYKGEDKVLFWIPFKFLMLVTNTFVFCCKLPDVVDVCTHYH